MTTRPVPSLLDDQLSEVEEFAGKTIRAATNLARSQGYTHPIFTLICGDLCVIRYRRQEKEVRHERTL